MASTLTISIGNPILSSEKTFLSSISTRSNRQMTSFNHRRAVRSTTVKSFAGNSAVLDRKRSSAATTSLYEILRVDRNASPIEIKNAYRSLAKVYHPDCASDSESDGRDFIEIHNAYCTLSDPSARAVYDLSLNCDRSFSYASARVYQQQTRRWETDQCW